MQSEPIHPPDYETSRDGDNSDTDVFVRCPRCKELNQTSWSLLESGSHHKCEQCLYEWKIKESSHA